MLRYELLMLAVPEITQDETKELELTIGKTAKEANASLISFERWGKYRLCYPVKRHDYGVYFLVRFETAVTQPVLGALASLFAIKLNDLVMRHVVTRLDPDQPLAYDRPPSVEDAPARDVDSFLRKNKMGGMYSKRGLKDAGGAEQEWSHAGDDSDNESDEQGVA